MSIKRSKNITTVLDILDAEVQGDTKRALKLLDPRYSMTWVYQAKNGMLFPKSGKNIERELAKVYPIKGRHYDIKHIAEGRDVVMVELVESYPDPKMKKVYRTPLVLVLEMRRGKIRRGRHYCDPRLSYLYLTKKQTGKIFT